jgi:outer membrane lipoprotein-sorting protein
MRRLLSLGALMLVVTVAACSSQKEPADAAIKSAQSAFNAVSAEAQKYVPDQAKSVQDALASVTKLKKKIAEQVNAMYATGA